MTLARKPQQMTGRERTRAMREALDRTTQPEVAAEILGACLGARIDPSGVRCTVQAERPDRFVMRAAIRTARGEARAYAIKVYLTDFGQQVWEFSRALARVASPDRDGPVLAIGYVPRFRALVFPWIEGERLSDIVDARKPELLRRAAALVAEFHRAPVDGVPPRGPETVVAETLDRCRRLRFRWPSLAAKIQRITFLLHEAAAAREPASSVVLHGDLAAGQFLWTGERLVLLDLDLVAGGDPARDVGHFLGQLERRCTLDPAVAPHEDEWLASFRETYCAAMPVSRRNVSLYQGLTLAHKMHTLSQRDPATGWRPAAALADRAQAHFEAVVRDADAAEGVAWRARSAAADAAAQAHPPSGRDRRDP